MENTMSSFSIRNLHNKYLIIEILSMSFNTERVKMLQKAKYTLSLQLHILASSGHCFVLFDKPETALKVEIALK